MEDKKEYFMKWRRNPLLVSLINTIFLLFSGMGLVILCDIGYKTVGIIFCCALILTDIAITIYANNYGWNTIIFFGEEKVFQKIKGQMYEWYWSDMEEFIFHSYLPIIALTPIVEITTIQGDKSLSFGFSAKRYKKFMEICKNEKIKEEMKKYFDD